MRVFFLRANGAELKLPSGISREARQTEDEYSFAEIDKDTPTTPTNPCVPSPCGPFATCRDSGYAGVPTCTCMDNYIGSPPNCRPECTVDSDCGSNRACLRQKCRDPCPGSCGIGAQCLVVNHMAVCLCSKGYTGDAFVSCYPEPPPRKPLDTLLPRRILIL